MVEVLDHGWPRRLRCSVQNYDWGSRAGDSAVARLFSLNSAGAAADIIIDGVRSYAELWMGTHDSGPSFLVPDTLSSDDFGHDSDDDGDGVPSVVISFFPGSNSSVVIPSATTSVSRKAWLRQLSAALPDVPAPVSLKAWLVDNPGALGEKVVERWGSDLPFLLKVLSVEKVLSIQAHPDKELAKRLHDARPDVYKDANHKPEMAIALTEFKAFCGFVSIDEFKKVLSNVPEITRLVGDEEADKFLNLKEVEASDQFASALKSIYTKLMTTNKDTVSKVVSNLKERLSSESKIRTLTEKEELILILEKQYPTDIGVISAFFLNFVKLKPGEALYLDADEPHAYIFGDCIECMAASDNVVRAGLTTKYKDVETLCSMLTYKQGFPEILRGNPLSPNVRRYTPPFDEFEVDHIQVLPGDDDKHTPHLSSLGPSVLLAVAGKGMMRISAASGRTVGIKPISEGDVLFVPAGTEVNFSVLDGHRPLDLYRAGVNSRFLT